MSFIKRMYVHMQTKMQEEKGATMVEYALMVALIAVVCIGMVTAVGAGSNTMFGNIAAAL